MTVTFLTWPALETSGADVAVTARSGGVSSGAYESLNLSLTVGDDPARVLANRRRLAAAFGASLEDFVFGRQVHGAGVRVVGVADRGSGTLTSDDAIPHTDALVTTAPGVVLAILTADCVPIALHDPVAGVLACVHSGWRGTVARVAAEAVAVMVKLGSRAEDILAGIGPAIDPARYQVGPEVHEAFQNATPASPPPAGPFRDGAFVDGAVGNGAFRDGADAFMRPDPAAEGRWLLDLWTANRLLLSEAGLREENIYVTDVPTGGDFFSDRAARPCGRLALVARLRGSAPEQAREMDARSIAQSTCSAGLDCAIDPMEDGARRA
jgi:polyphenol oxidase